MAVGIRPRAKPWVIWSDASCVIRQVRVSVSGFLRTSNILWQLSSKTKTLISFQKLLRNRNRAFAFMTSRCNARSLLFVSLCEHTRGESRYLFIENSVFLSQVGFLQCLSFNALWFALIQCDESPLRLTVSMRAWKNQIRP